MNDSAYLIAFSTVPNIGAARAKLLLEYFGTARKAWEAPQQEILKVGLPKDALADFLEQRRKLNIGDYLEKINKRGIKVVTLQDKGYPERLRNIPSPPLALFIKTNLAIEQFNYLTVEKIIAVVGTRKVSSYGKEVTEMLTTGLCTNGFTIVSGMALGVDGIAHGTALNSGGKTIAVLGAGVEIVYPREHRDLYNSILDRGGVVVSEVAPEKFVARGVFPARNRIISGLSEAVLVTEGAIDSGSLITVRAALDQGREVFAVPGPINSSVNEGTNHLLKNGAKLVSSVQDILDELGYQQDSRKIGGKESRREMPTGDTEEEQKIIDILENESVDFDELVRRTEIKSGQLAAILSIMEIKGVVKNTNLQYRLS